MQIYVNRELQIFAGYRGFFFERLADFAAVTVHHDSAGAVLAHENRVVLQLDSGFTHDIAGIIEFETGLVQHVLADLADVADQVRHESLERIKATVGHDGVKLGQFGPMRFNEGFFVGSDVFF